jgi:BlaR1 peptidase M56
LGWLRPVVVLPLSVLAGLTPWQLEAIIAHELAHIRRWDAFVNLFQVTTETLLFYHPGVWWVNRVIRNEREHCCDDVAVAACGNAHGYARTLALLEESRAASSMVLAANGGVLTTRIGRLLGVKKATRTMSAPSVALLAFLSIAGALMAGSASTQAIGDLPQPPAPPRPVAAPRVILADVVPMAITLPAPILSVSPVHTARLAAANEAPAHSYIGDLQAAGLKDLTVEEIIALKIQGVTPEYIRGLSAAGLSNLRVQDYLAARVQGITPEFVQKIRSHGFKDLTLRQLISLEMADIS